jgi:alpha-L-arabinofuranosidase
MQLLADMKPAFLRFPGGNYLEGNTIATRFEWKKTIGDTARRPGHLDNAWHYWSSDGMGLLEFLEWYEDLHMQPLLAVYAGYSLRGERVAPGPDLEPYVAEALDEIEYVTGPVTSARGARRAKDGHPVTAQGIPTREWQPPARRGGANGQPAPLPPPPQQVPTLFYSITRDSQAGTIYLKIVNRAATPQPVRVEIAGLARVESKGQSIVLKAAGPDDTHSITDPTKIAPVTTSVDGLGSSFTREFPPYSITVLELRGN